VNCAILNVPKWLSVSFSLFELSFLIGVLFLDRSVARFSDHQISLFSAEVRFLGDVQTGVNNLSQFTSCQLHGGIQESWHWFDIKRNPNPFSYIRTNVASPQFSRYGFLGCHRTFLFTQHAKNSHFQRCLIPIPQFVCKWSISRVKQFVSRHTTRRVLNQLLNKR
jgi:hypothetical protein